MALSKVDLRRDARLIEYADMLTFRSQAINYYSPQDYQIRFHLVDKPVRCISWGNKTGKTLCASWEFCCHLTGLYPKWFPLHLRMSGVVRGRVIINDFGKVFTNDLLPYLEKWIPQCMYESNGGYRKKNHEGLYATWQLSNGSNFHIMSNEQDVEQYEGAEIDILWINEPCDRDKFIASKRGLVVTSGQEGRGKVIFSLTPLGLTGWLFDDVLSDPQYAYVSYVGIAENQYLTKTAIAEFSKGLSEEEKEARLHGRPIHLSGRIYKEFDRAVHCVKRFDIPEDWTRYMVVDPHEGKPFAIAWAAIDPMNEVFWYDYLWSPDRTIEELGSAVKGKEGRDAVYKRIMDVHYMHKPLMDTRTTLGDAFFEKCGLVFEGSSTDLILRLSAMRKYLKYDKTRPIDIGNRPKMYWFQDLEVPIIQMERYVWDRKGSRPEDKNSDFPDVFGYLATENPQFHKTKSLIVTLPQKMKRRFV